MYISAYIHAYTIHEREEAERVYVYIRDTFGHNFYKYHTLTHWVVTV